jgi:uncharacterized protein HemY
MGRRIFVRLEGHKTVEDALDQAERMGAKYAALSAQPSVPVCGTIEVEERETAEETADELMAEIVRLEEEARRLREVAEAVMASRRRS